MPLKTRSWIILLALVLLVCGGLSALLLLPGEPAAFARITSRGAVVGILAHLGQYRIAQFLAGAAQRISGGDAHPADIVGRMGVVHSAGHGGQQRSTAGLELRLPA